MATLLAGRNLEEAIRGILARPGRIRVAVAYWGEGAVARFRMKDLRTRDISVVCDLLSGSCNPREIRRLRDELGSGRVRTLDNLHAKVWIAETAAIVGSSNASTNGLGREGDGVAGLIEANLLVTDRGTIRQLREWFDAAVAHLARPITDDDILRADERWTAVSKVRATLRPLHSSGALSAGTTAAHPAQPADEVITSETDGCSPAVRALIGPTANAPRRGSDIARMMELMARPAGATAAEVKAAAHPGASEKQRQNLLSVDTVAKAKTYGLDRVVLSVPSGTMIYALRHHANKPELANLVRAVRPDALRQDDFRIDIVPLGDRSKRYVVLASEVLGRSPANGRRSPGSGNLGVPSRAEQILAGNAPIPARDGPLDLGALAVFLGTTERRIRSEALTSARSSTAALTKPAAHYVHVAARDQLKRHRPTQGTLSQGSDRWGPGTPGRAFFLSLKKSRRVDRLTSDELAHAAWGVPRGWVRFTPRGT